VTTPIREGAQTLATLRIGMSLERLHRQIAQTRIGIGVLSALILAAGLIAVVLISNVLTRPLREVAAGAQRVAAGDLRHRVPAGRGDEIGQLAATFNDMAEKVAERDASLRQLSRRLLSIQEQERVRIAREVHDELGQALTAMKIDLQQLGKHHHDLREPLAGIGHTIDEIVELVRRIAADLRPSILDDLGVTAALEQQLRRLRESTGIKTTLTVSEEPEIDMLTGATLYRIAKEALANVVRHANATTVEVSLTMVDGAVVLKIRDDGRGMPGEIDPKSLGLLGIRERAELLGGSVAIDSRPGEGTMITATLPCASSASTTTRSSGKA
jgi:signal transduction histidine kinase